MDAQAHQRGRHRYREHQTDECATARQPARLARRGGSDKAKYYGDGVLHDSALGGEKLRRVRSEALSCLTIPFYLSRSHPPTTPLSRRRRRIGSVMGPPPPHLEVAIRLYELLKHLEN